MTFAKESERNQLNVQKNGGFWKQNNTGLDIVHK